MRKEKLKQLDNLLTDARVMGLPENGRLVIFSDLHLGDGGRADDFRHNGRLFSRVLAEYYEPRQYTLLLNGDIEELLRFSLKKIKRYWKKLYAVFDRFALSSRLIKVPGNHDPRSGLQQLGERKTAVVPAVRFKCGNDCQLVVFHGHQAGLQVSWLNPVLRLLLRWIANPLGIRNYTVAFNSRKKYRLEQRIYDFARTRKILAVMGHTHRPLFESLSRLDTLKFRIEELCREYPLAQAGEKNRLEREILKMKKEFYRLVKAPGKYAGHEGIYNPGPLVPCLFNSGYGIGKNGITAIEIHDGRIELVYWFDADRSKKYMDFEGRKASRLKGSSFYRMELKGEALEYVFARIRLLA